MMQVNRGRWCVPRPAVGDDEPVPTHVHFEQFVPLLTDWFGGEWWHRGGLSLRLVAPTVRGEPVCCHLQPLDRERCRIWINAEGEALVARGTAALGEDPGSELIRQLTDITPAPGRRALGHVRPGQVLTQVPVRIPASEVAARLPSITEPMTCYRRADGGHGPVAPPATTAAAMKKVAHGVAGIEVPCRPPQAVELRHLNGPVFSERDYRVHGRVLAVTETDTEDVLWYQADLHDAGDQSPVARLLCAQSYGLDEVPE